ncbi:MAG: hypothetical protein ING14_07810, partial [Burkholderiales bacterium]|nr:hypothetical protein [Burkholderiales bacterium]
MSQYDENSKNPSNMQSLKESRNIMPSLIVILFVIVLGIFLYPKWQSMRHDARIKKNEIKAENAKKLCLIKLPDEKIRAAWAYANSEFAVQVSEREKNAKTVEDEKIKEENKRLARCSDVAYSIRNESECKSNGYRFYYEDTRGVDYSHPNLEYIFERDRKS